MEERNIKVFTLRESVLLLTYVAFNSHTASTTCYDGGQGGLLNDMPPL